jgi:hypothetical protein
VILHVVLIRPRAASDDRAFSALDRALAALPSKIAGIVDYRFGVNASPEGMDRGYDHGFVMTFESEAARDAYLPHPEHREIHPLVDAVAAEVLVFDLAI